MSQDLTYQEQTERKEEAVMSSFVVSRDKWLFSEQERQPVVDQFLPHELVKGTWVML